MLSRHDQRGQAVACNDNGPFPAFWTLIAPNSNIAGVAGSVRARANLKSGYHLLWLLAAKYHTILYRLCANRAVWRES